jgi:hypothetical protein
MSWYGSVARYAGAGLASSVGSLSQASIRVRFGCFSTRGGQYSVAAVRNGHGLEESWAGWFDNRDHGPLRTARAT